MANTHRKTVGAGLWLRLRNNFNTNIGFSIRCLETIEG